MENMSTALIVITIMIIWAIAYFRFEDNCIKKGWEVIDMSEWFFDGINYKCKIWEK